MADSYIKFVRSVLRLRPHRHSIWLSKEDSSIEAKRIPFNLRKKIFPELVKNLQHLKVTDVTNFIPAKELSKEFEDGTMIEQNISSFKVNCRGR